MFQKKCSLIVILIFLCAIMMCGCGNLQDMGTSETYIEDTAVYGNSYNNIRNDGAAYIDENGRVVYFCKADEKALIGNVSNANANIITHVQLYYINVVGDTMYAYVRWVGDGFVGDGYGYFGGGLMAYDLTTPQDEIDWYSIDIIREGVVLDLQVVDGICYFTDGATKRFCKFDPATGEETILIEEPYGEAMVYQNQVFFTMEEENGALYSLSLANGEKNKLTSSNSRNLIAYKDKILYFSKVFGFDFLKAIQLDGENDTFLKKWTAEEVTLYGDRLYFVAKDDKSDIGFMDLTDEKLEVQSLNLKAGIQEQLQNFAGEQLAAIIRGYGMEEVIKDTECMHLSAINGYLLFDGGYVMTCEPYRCMYAYCLETGELTLLNHQFNVPMEWKNILWDTEEADKEAWVAHWVEREAEFQKDVGDLIKTKDVLIEYYTVEEIDLGQAIIDKIVKPEMSEYEKFKTIYDYIMDHVRYDYKSYFNNTSYKVQDQQPIGALRDGLAVCGGYAHTLELLCVLADIDCVYVSGLAKQSQEPHAWNKVKIDGEWYNVDITWDDTDTGYYSYAYFCVSDSYFYKTHEAYEPIIYFLPECPRSYKGIDLDS